MITVFSYHLYDSDLTSIPSNTASTFWNDKAEKLQHHAEFRWGQFLERLLYKGDRKPMGEIVLNNCQKWLITPFWGMFVGLIHLRNNHTNRV